MVNIPTQTQVVHDVLDPARAAAMSALQGHSGPHFDRGAILPKFWHHLYFWDPRAPQDLGDDGHIKTGTGLIPDLGLPQRMWAGGTLEFLGDVQFGQPTTRETAVENVTEKTGRSGRLGFVTLLHKVFQGDAVKVVERQDLVYRDPPDQRSITPPPQARTDELVSVSAEFSSTMLFRYSALTFNGHRIHYDLDYCRDVEGYPGLVVHGPLLAQGLIDLAEQQLGPITRFEFRATAPLFHFETAEFCLNETELWVRGPDGRQCMTARVTL